MQTKKEDILKKAIEIVKAKEEEKFINPDDFNVFSILGMERKEVTAHSAFLYALLNTEGEHRRGDYFLRKFVEIVMGIKVPIQSKLYALREMAFEDGRIDLLIVINENQYAIEIKIDAGEQPLQLQRYYDWTNNNVYFLALSKKKPTSCSDEIIDKIICVSFKEEIVQWLAECKKEVDNKTLEVIISQYINLILKLTKEFQGDLEIMNLIKGKESFEAINELIEAQTSFKTKFLTDFFHRLAKELDFSDFCFPFQTHEPYFQNYYKERTWPKLYFEFKINKEQLDLDENHALFFQIEVNDNLHTFVAIRNKDNSLLDPFPTKYNKLISLFFGKKHIQKMEENYKYNFFWEHIFIDGKLLNFRNQKTGIYMNLLSKDNENGNLFDDNIFNQIKNEIIRKYEDAKSILKDYIIQLK